MSSEYLTTHPSLIILSITISLITIVFIKYKKNYKELLNSCFKKEETTPERKNISLPTLLTLEDAEQVIPEIDTFFPGRQITILEADENEENSADEFEEIRFNYRSGSFNSPTEEARDILFITTSK